MVEKTVKGLVACAVAAVAANMVLPVFGRDLRDEFRA